MENGVFSRKAAGRLGLSVKFGSAQTKQVEQGGAIIAIHSTIVEAILHGRQFVRGRGSKWNRVAERPFLTLVGLLKRWGPPSVCRRVWDFEYEHGYWDFLDDGKGHAPGEGRPDPIVEVLDRYARGGRILDLGCGKGRLAWQIADSFESYLGVDISEAAIAKARAFDPGYPQRKARIHFQVGEIGEFTSTERFTVIVFQESIYYVAVARILQVLGHHASNLSAQGVFVIRIFDRGGFGELQSRIAENFRVVETVQEKGGSGMVLVFAPRTM